MLKELNMTGCETNDFFGQDSRSFYFTRQISYFSSRTKNAVPYIHFFIRIVNSVMMLKTLIRILIIVVLKFFQPGPGTVIISPNYIRTTDL